MQRPLHIIGHGLAGAVLAEAAHQRGLPVSVSHDDGPSSSRVAAGMFTPVTGMKLNPTWLAEAALPCMRQFYRELETLVGARFFHPLPLLRILQQAADRDPDPMWFHPADAEGLPFAMPHGCLGVRQSGWVDLNCMLDALAARRKQLGQWTDSPPEGACTVWAEGHRAAAHPLWQEAGWRNAHGDVLTLRIDGLPEDRIYSFGKFLLPLGMGLFRCGATYAWNCPSPLPREQGRDELEARLRETLSLPFEVVQHEAGIRPVALSRVPILGPHPEEADQLIFNGFGSKGVLYAPLMAQRLLDWMEDGTKPEAEVWAPRRILRQRERRRHGHSDV